MIPLPADDDQVKKTWRCHNCDRDAGPCNGDMVVINDAFWQCSNCGQYYDRSISEKPPTCPHFLCVGCGQRTSDYLCACTCSPSDASAPQGPTIPTIDVPTADMPTAEMPTARMPTAQMPTLPFLNSAGVRQVDIPDLPLHDLPGKPGDFILNARGEPIARLGAYGPTIVPCSPPLTERPPHPNMAWDPPDDPSQPMDPHGAGLLGRTPLDEPRHPYQGYFPPPDPTDPHASY